MPYDAGHKIIIEHLHENGKLKHVLWDDGEESFRNENGLFHRMDGPAILFPNGDKLYFINGTVCPDIKTDEEFMIKVLLE